MTERRTESVCRLRQWPCKLSAMPETAPYLDGADLLIAADCTAYAYGNIHADFMQGKITLICCPRQSERENTEKLTRVLKENTPESITLLRMEVGCCDALERAVHAALSAIGEKIPLRTVILSTDGKILSDAD